MWPGRLKRRHRRHRLPPGRVRAARAARHLLVLGMFWVVNRTKRITERLALKLQGPFETVGNVNHRPVLLSVFIIVLVLGYFTWKNFAT